MTHKIRIGVQIHPQHASFGRMRDAALEAEERGADVVFNWDHFYPLFGEPDGEHFDGDPRAVLRRNLERAAEFGYTYYLGPEIEYFYFKDSKGTVPLDEGGYFDQNPQDLATDLRRETVLTLEELGIPVESSHHEVAASGRLLEARHLRLVPAKPMDRHLMRQE